MGNLLSGLFRPRAQQSARTRDLYLDLLVNSLLNELYLENEARLLYIFEMLLSGKPVDTDIVRQISTLMPELTESIRSARQDGTIWWLRGDLNLRNLCNFSHTMVGRKRLENVLHCLDRIRVDRVPGDVIETGAWRGGVCILMRGYLEAWGMDKTVWVADSFEGLPKPSLPQDAGHDYTVMDPILAVSIEEVQDTFRRYGLLDDRVRFLKGWFRDTLPTAPIDSLALLRLDGDLYESTMDALTALYHKVVPGGFVIIDDYGDFEPCRRAVEEFRRKNRITDPLRKIDWTGCYWRKEHG